MPWKVEKAEQTRDVASITVKHVLADGTDDADDKGNLVTRTLRHQRDSFPDKGPDVLGIYPLDTGKKQHTLTEWRANIKREVRAAIALWDAEEVASTPQDITAAVR